MTDEVELDPGVKSWVWMRNHHDDPRVERVVVEYDRSGTPVWHRSVVSREDVFDFRKRVEPGDHIRWKTTNDKRKRFLEVERVSDEVEAVSDLGTRYLVMPSTELQTHSPVPAVRKAESWASMGELEWLELRVEEWPERD